MGSRSLFRLSAGIGVLCTFSAVAPGQVHAGGIEYTGQGTQSLGRGGAVTARAQDPMVIAHNPAGLAELRGNQMLLDLNFALMDACVDPVGYYGWGVYTGGAPSRLPDPRTGEYESVPLGQIDRSGPIPVPVAQDYYTDPYDTVCLNQNVGPIPQLAFTFRLSDRIGVGLGMIFPSAMPSGSWGQAGTGVIRGDTGELRPAATRYQLLNANNLGMFPNLALGYRVTDWLRLGASLEYGYVAVDTTAMAPATGTTSFNNDIVAHVEAFDYWVPAATASVHLVPTDALDIVAAFRWQDDIDAKGRTEFTSGIFDPTKMRNTSSVDVNHVQQNMPWKLRGGIRYASRRVARPTSSTTEYDLNGHEVLHDPLADERWDIELDVEYQANSRNQQVYVDFVDGQTIQFKPEGTGQLPAEIWIQKRWKDQWSVRMGGTANVLPGVLGISAGVHYETRGVDPAFMQVDMWPLARVGLHTGVTFRVSNTIDLVFSYAHIFQETLIVAAPEHKNRFDIYDAADVLDDQGNIVSVTPDYLNDLDGNGNGIVRNIDQTVGVLTDRFAPEGMNGLVVLPAQVSGKPDGVAALQQNTNTTTGYQPPVITNAGRYRSNMDVIAIGANIHF